MRKYLKLILGKIGVLQFLRIRRRLVFALSYYKRNIKLAYRWAKTDSEDSNFYYNLDPRNEDYLVALISNIMNAPKMIVEKYVNEIKNNQDLRKRLKNELISSGYPRDIEINFARRIGWYAIARIMKPKVIVETGVDHGVGACVLSEAIFKNEQEGFPGRYFGTDINLEAGKLLSDKYRRFSTILYGDSIESLNGLNESIDLFINDSDHSSDYELLEYQAVLNKLSDRSVIIGDNSHVTDRLLRFSEQTFRNFYFFREEPLDHWYPGAGIGISIARSKNDGIAQL